MARKDGKDRGILQRKGREGWWVRLYENGRQRWFRCDTKSQAKALYGRLNADAREGKYFPEKYAPTKDITLRAWISRYLDGSTNRCIADERRYGRRWSLLLGKRLLPQIMVDDLRRIQAKMRAKTKIVRNKPQRLWADATIKQAVRVFAPCTNVGR